MNELEKQVAKAEAFRAMHLSPELLLLANAWDVGSAVVFQKAGFGALGTSSAGLANGLGQPDGEQLTLEDLLLMVRRILARVDLPLTVDMEAGYGAAPEEVAASVASVVRAGAVGMNIEDAKPVRAGRAAGLVELSEQLEVIRAVVAQRSELGVPFVLNARTDYFWLGLGSPAEQLAGAVERGNAYLEAGADCVFVPGNLEAGTIRELAQNIAGPINIIAAAATPSPAELEELGVARLSIGSGPARSAYGLVRRIARELLAGSYETMRANDLGYDEANRLFD